MEEERQDYSRIDNNIEEIFVLLKAHTTKEDEEIRELHSKLDNLERYFGDAIDAHTHKHHHEWSQDKIDGEQNTGKWWSDIKKVVVQAAIIAAGGAIIAFIIHATWKDVKTEVKKEDVTTIIKEDKNV